MIHEILLALSGYQSPLLEPESFSDIQYHDASQSLALSSSEKQLLAKLGKLSRTHRHLKLHLDAIVKKHSSMICRATAISIRQIHLERFQAKILDVEASILRRDTTTVGAYDIVPLAYIVGQFDDWHGRMAWYWSLATFILPTDKTTSASTGAAVIDKLQADAQTGFPDIEDAAIELSKVAELTWLKQLASWVLHGSVLRLAKDDFFIQQETDEFGHAAFRKSGQLLPKFISDTTANSILFIGRSLNQIRDNDSQKAAKADLNKMASLEKAHIQLLSSLTLPLSVAELNRTVAALKMSLSRNVLQDLLPLQTTRTLLQVLRKFFLLRDSDFATCLINEAERRVEARWQTMDRLAQQDPIKALQGLSIKDTETNQALRQTWKLMVSTGQHEDEDETMEFARKHLTLTTLKKPPSRPSTSDSTVDARPKLSPVPFNDLLFASPTSLTLQIRPPMDLLLSAFDIVMYTTMNSYLLSIRRAQLRLEDLWRLSSTRRSTLKRTQSQHITSRKFWAACSAALLLLSELAAYLGSDVIHPSFTHFEDWACTTASSIDHSQADEVEDVQKDPETLSAGHRIFVDSLAHGLLLTDFAYTKELRSLLGAIDQMTSLFTRMLNYQDKDNLRSSQSDTPAREEQRVQHELDKACQKVDNDRKGVVIRLRDLHQLRIGPDRFFSVAGRANGGYEPWKIGGLDHLLMKLEYGRPNEDEDIFHYITRDQATQKTLCDLCHQGQLNVPIKLVWKMEDVQQAHRAWKAGATGINVLIIDACRSRVLKWKVASQCQQT